MGKKYEMYVYVMLQRGKKCGKLSISSIAVSHVIVNYIIIQSLIVKTRDRIFTGTSV